MLLVLELECIDLTTWPAPPMDLAPRASNITARANFRVSRHFCMQVPGMRWRKPRLVTHFLICPLPDAWR